MQLLDEAEYSKLEFCFYPHSAAIVGASTNPAKFGGKALKYCLERGYDGRMYPINAQADEVQGVKAYSALSDLPETPDIAVIAVPAPLVKGSVLEAAQMGVKVAVIYGAQFAEVGAEGQKRQDDLVAIARQHGMRLVGPNCLGVVALASGFIASFASAPDHHEGNGWPDVGSISVASQSGGVGMQIFSQLRDRGLGLANWISTGNQADIDVADAIAYFASDEKTKTIAIYMEDASRGVKLTQSLELARRAKKPVVIYKVGTTPEGGDASAGHTASMYVEDRMLDDVFKQYGVLRAYSVNDLIELVAACDAGNIPASNDVVVISCSGGAAVMMTDVAAQRGLNLIDLPEDALAALKETNSFVNDRNPIDISAPSMSNMEIVAGHLRWGLERNAPTMIGYMSHAPFVPKNRHAIVEQLLTFGEAYPDKLIALAANFFPEDRKALVQSGVAVFDDPTIATEAVAKLVAAGQAFQKPATEPALTAPAGDLTERLEAAGITRLEETPAATLDDARRHMTGPSVLKLKAPTLLHKTEIGGVVTGIKTEADLVSAFATLERQCTKHADDYPGLHITISPQVSGVEVIIGVRQDDYFGPLVVLGSGGVNCEIFNDVTYRKAPFGKTDAVAMVDALRTAPMLQGWRGAPAVNRAALEEALVALAERAASMPSFEINPLIVTPSGIVGVDLVTASAA
ncbi:MAG: acetate--CoA ligase family protein [Pseudomonadota bacterium]